MTGTRKRPSGRPREFQPSEVAQSALEAFWAGGFHEVSVPDLEEATGVVRTSLYNTFGNKRGLFDAALEAYLGQLFAEIDSMLTEATGGLDDIHGFLDTLEGWHLSGIPGCFMINSMVEFADRDPEITTRGGVYLDKLRDGLRAALVRAHANGEVPDSAALDSEADRLLLQTIGLNTAARSGLHTDRLRALYRSAHDAVTSLGTPGS
jgi:TetR/AcrR family transcriptional repressor of nem operon